MAPTERMRINSDGHIGIGTNTPSEKSSVIGNASIAGNITTKKVIVTQSGWPDYVFHPAYKLRPLSENGAGQPLYVDLNKVDLSGVHTEDFNGVGSTQVVNLLLKSSLVEDGLIYGNITLKSYPNDNVRAYSDKYDFEMHSSKNPMNLPRNIETKIGAKVAGKGNPFSINFNGAARLTPVHSVIK